MEAVRLPPAGLSEKAKHTWATIDENFELNESEFILFEVCVRAYDRLEDIRAGIDEYGLLDRDMNGHVKRMHPLFKAEQECFATFQRYWKQLSFGESVLDVGRPASNRQKRRGPPARKDGPNTGPLTAFDDMADLDG